MAEPLKKDPLSPEADTPQPFRNQELQGDGRSLDTVPAEADLRVETLSSNVVAWKQPSEATTELIGVEDPFLVDVSETDQDGQNKLADLAQRGQEAAQEMADRARRRFSYWADQYPLELFAGIAGIGFLAGVLLRIWRSNRYE